MGRSAGGDAVKAMFPSAVGSSLDCREFLCGMSAPRIRRQAVSNHVIARGNCCLFLQRFQALSGLLNFVGILIVSDCEEFLIVLYRLFCLMQMIERRGAKK